MRVTKGANQVAKRIPVNYFFYQNKMLKMFRVGCGCYIAPGFMGVYLLFLGGGRMFQRIKLV